MTDAGAEEHLRTRHRLTDSGQDATGMTLHLTTDDVWGAHQGQTHYRPERFDEEGFIHCTNGEANLIAVGNLYYRSDPRRFVVLDIDLSRVKVRAVYEDEDSRFPHIYGPLDIEAVVRVRRIERSAEGSFVAIGNDEGSHHQS